MPTEAQVVDSLKQVYDPEIPVNVYDLGLIYSVQVLEEKKVQIDMTLTTQGCPMARQIPELVKARVGALPDVDSVDVQLVWEPRWNPSMISSEGKKILNLTD